MPIHNALCTRRLHGAKHQNNSWYCQMVMSFLLYPQILVECIYIFNGITSTDKQAQWNLNLKLLWLLLLLLLRTHLMADFIIIAIIDCNPFNESPKNISASNYINTSYLGHLIVWARSEKIEDWRWVMCWGINASYCTHQRKKHAN